MSRMVWHNFGNMKKMFSIYPLRSFVFFTVPLPAISYPIGVPMQLKIANKFTTKDS